MEFNPPIEGRETDELIIISKSSTDEYQARAIELAKKELDKRKIFQTNIDKRYNELLSVQEKVFEQKTMDMEAEDYNVFEKIWIVIFWPKELFRGWYLGREGYKTKAANRIKLILIGIALDALIILLSKF